MELALSLGETPKAFTFLDKSSAHETNKKMVVSNNNNINKDLGFCMALQVKGCDNEEGENNNNNNNNKKTRYDVINERRDSSDPPVQLDLLPFSPVNISRTSSSSQHLMTFSWLTENLGVEPGLSKRQTEVNRRSIGLVEKGTGGGGGEEGSGGGTGSFLSSSPNSTTSSFQMEFSMYRSSTGGGRTSNNYKRDFEGNEIDETDRDRNGACSRASDEEENENGMARKKLRLSKEQSAFLEESFKEHNTLNPKQKQALAKQLNLRPRQVEVWFQNRRARTKLKQTEVDCEYLKKCCETLTEENRRLQKELQELRALKSSQPFYMQLPATTLTMCPSCERVATTATTTTTTTTPATNGSSTPTVAVAAAGTGTTANTTLSLAKPRAVHHHHHHHQVTS